MYKDFDSVELDICLIYIWYPSDFLSTSYLCDCTVGCSFTDACYVCCTYICYRRAQHCWRGSLSSRKLPELREQDRLLQQRVWALPWGMCRRNMPNWGRPMFKNIDSKSISFVYIWRAGISLNMEHREINHQNDGILCRLYIILVINLSDMC